MPLPSGKCRTVSPALEAFLPQRLSAEQTLARRVLLGGATRDGNLAFQCGFQEGVAAVATHALPKKSETQK